MSTQSPTKVGPYYWRESNGDRWQVVNVFDVFAYKLNDVTEYSIDELQGQLRPIPTAEELLELKAAKKMVDEGMVMLPKKLTSENGLKFLLIGEFHEIIENPFHDADDDESPETLKVQVSWTTIKDIYAKIVKHYTEEVME